MAEPPDPAAGRWVPPARPTMVAGHRIPGGLIYVGRHLRAPTGSVEPALINPDLRIGEAAAPITDPGPDLAYHLLSPASRAAYLRWLADGRDTDVPVGLVRLFCFGLERRVLVDGDGPAVRGEMPAITAEVRRLRARYGENLTVDRLLDLLELLAAPRGASGTKTTFATGAVTGMGLRVALARFAAASAPVPVDWAHTWVRHHPSLTPGSAQVRCPQEFHRLFALRYRDTHGAGLIPPDDVPGVRLRYQPENPGLTTTLVCREDLPDVLADPRTTRALRTVLDSVAAALDPYCRWLARYPQGRGSLAAATMLPPELVDASQGRLGALRVWAESKLDNRPLTVIDAAEFGTFWPTAARDRMDRDEAAAFLSVLGMLGFGVEPDVRFGAPTLTPGPAVLFRLGAPATDRPSTRFPAAAAVVKCAAAVVSAATPVGPRPVAGSAVLGTIRDLAVLLGLDPGEDVRMMARLAWLLATGVDIDRLGRQIASLDETGRTVAAHHLIEIAAAADPATGAATIGALTRVYRILGLEPNLIFGRLHERSLGRSPVRWAHSPGTGSDEPVVVQRADNAARGYALPWATIPEPTGVPLDRTAIMRKLTESAAAATILTDIFNEGEPEETRAPSIADTDRAHNLLLRALATQPTWTREEFASLATQHGMLPDGAIDLLNEIALDTVGARVVEDDDTLTVNHSVIQELLA